MKDEPQIDKSGPEEKQGPVIFQMPPSPISDEKNPPSPEPKKALGNSEPQEFFNVDDDTLEKNVNLKLGILGGKGVGKSYLFHAMVYRACSPGKSGATSYFLQNGKTSLASATKLNEKPINANIMNFISEYTSWYIIKQNNLEECNWYRLRLEYKTGILGLKRDFLDVRFFDGPGEAFSQAVNSETNIIWIDGFLNADIIVFCLPLWVAFPGNLGGVDLDKRETVLRDFHQVVDNFSDLRKKNAKNRVKSILALTMADDRRSALDTLREKWITTYMEQAPVYLDALKTGKGLANYLANARKVSESVGREFQKADDGRISGIPNKLNFGAGEPWLIPLSAIDGSTLERKNSATEESSRNRAGAPPVPAHVELPLLVALCENNNALI